MQQKVQACLALHLHTLLLLTWSDRVSTHINCVTLMTIKTITPPETSPFEKHLDWCSHQIQKKKNSTGSFISFNSSEGWDNVEPRRTTDPDEPACVKKDIIDRHIELNSSDSDPEPSAVRLGLCPSPPSLGKGTSLMVSFHSLKPFPLVCVFKSFYYVVQQGH